MDPVLAQSISAITGAVVMFIVAATSYYFPRGTSRFDAKKDEDYDKREVDRDRRSHDRDDREEERDEQQSKRDKRSKKRDDRARGDL